MIAIILIIIIQSVIAYACSVLAKKKGRSPSKWAFLGLFLGTLALIYLALAPEKKPLLIKDNNIIKEQKELPPGEIPSLLIHAETQLRKGEPTEKILLELKNKGVPIKRANSWLSECESRHFKNNDKPIIPQKLPLKKQINKDTESKSTKSYHFLKFLTYCFVFFAFISQSVFIHHNGSLDADPIGLFLFLFLLVGLYKILEFFELNKRILVKHFSFLIFSLVFIFLTIVSKSPIKFGEKFYQKMIREKIEFVRKHSKSTKPILNDISMDLRHNSSISKKTINKIKKIKEENYEPDRKYDIEKKSNNISDKLIESLIDKTTPDADESVRRVQRNAVKFLLDPRKNHQKNI